MKNKVVKKKPSDFIRAGDVVIFPADDRGIRLIKIVPNTDYELTLARWLMHGATLFTDPIPKCGYIFEDRSEKWAPEKVDDGIWEPQKYMSLPDPKIKDIAEKVSTGSYEIVTVRVKCDRCGDTREAPRPARDIAKGVMYQTAWCPVCNKETLHSITKGESVDIKLPPIPEPKQQKLLPEANVKKESRFRLWLKKLLNKTQHLGL